MFRMSTFWRILLFLFLVVLLVAIGYGVYRLGYAQGYQDARVAINGGGRSAIRPLPFYGGVPFYDFGPRIRFPFFFSLFVPFFWIGIILLIFFIVRALIKPWGAQHKTISSGSTGTGYMPSDPNAPGVNPGDAGPYDPYHVRDKQVPAGDQPGTSGGPGPTQFQS
jgi:hypothetical protein